ncbi:hypothetical protein [Halorubrum aethiopicum]|nr:hypothetical protein [Halorubrum aethiopicum]
MSKSEKPEGDLADSEAVREGKDGKPRARMAELKKSSSGGEDSDE